ncbi:MAG: hypothetical protein ACRDJF_03640 [Actinomycetota bacterium]
MPFFEWLRQNSERYLLEDAQREMARKYLGQEPPRARSGPRTLFWRRVYVPVYRRLPWGVRRALIVAMPGSHRRRWGGRAPP